LSLPPHLPMSPPFHVTITSTPSPHNHEYSQVPSYFPALWLLLATDKVTTGSTG
jgi:hypothetical protein